MHRTAFVAIAAILGIVSPAAGQDRVTYSVEVGAGIDPAILPSVWGQQLSVGAMVGPPVKGVRVRIEGTATRMESYDGGLSSRALFLIDPAANPAIPYLLLGGGVAFDTVRPTASVGVGWDLPARLSWGSSERQLPLYTELRLNSGRMDPYFALGLGVLW